MNIKLLKAYLNLCDLLELIPSFEGLRDFKNSILDLRVLING